MLSMLPKNWPDYMYSCSRCQFVSPPSVNRTIAQADYKADGFKGHVRARPVKLPEGGNLILKDVPPQYNTAYAGTFVGAAERPPEVKAGRRAGHPATMNSGYNILTGGSPLNNNAFERFQGGQDYRRHR